MVLLYVCVVLLSLYGADSRLLIDDGIKIEIQNEIDLANIKRAIIDDKRNEIDHKSNDVTNEINGTVVAPISNSTNIEVDRTTEALNLIPKHLPPIDNGTALLLTPLLEAGNQVEARSQSKVNPKHFLGVESYSGFFTVNKTYNSNQFFWYFPAWKGSTDKTPWIVWLQGGPGVSSLAGLFGEVGPFRVFNASLRVNPYTWNKEHSMVFIDNPIGAGYSFTDSPDGFAKNMETYRDHLYSTISQLLQVFPELRTAPLYIAGESYAGKYVPALGLALHQQKAAGNLEINLQGFLIGNAFVDPDVIKDPSMPMMYVGLLQQQQIDNIRPLLDRFKQNIEEKNSIEAKKNWMTLIWILLTLTKQHTMYNFLRDEFVLGNYMSFLESSDIKKALHVGDIKYNVVNFTANMELAPDFLWNSRPVFEELLENYRVLAYCGQLDMMIPCVYSSQNQAQWKWSQSEKFRNSTRYPYIFRGKLVGYHKEGGNLMEMVVRGAGHMVPLDAPAVAYDMVSKFIGQRPFTNVTSTMTELMKRIQDQINSLANEQKNEVDSNSTTFYL